MSHARAKALPPTSYLRECLEYVPDGTLVWRVRQPSHFTTRRNSAIWNTRYAGKRAGSSMSNGYRLLSVDGQKYLEHRVIYALVNGAISPDQCVDHADQDHRNNRAENLRACTHAENLMNQPGRRQDSGLPKHVVWSHRERKFKVAMRANGVVHHIGTFATLNDATQAAEEARKRLHGAFADNRRHA